MKRHVVLLLILVGCAWTDHHWDVPVNATPEEIQKINLHNCREDAFQTWRHNHDSDGDILAIGAGGVIGGAIGGAAAGAAVGSSDSLSDFTKNYVPGCMKKKGYKGTDY